MNPLTSSDLERFNRDGCLLLTNVFTPDEVERLCRELDPLLCEAADDVSIRNRGGLVFAARNVLQVWPDVFNVCLNLRLQEMLISVLGRDCGLVRVLYFDKPPGRTWALPWHKDLTIAIEPPDVLPNLGGASWEKVRMKAGVPHVEADEATLSQMLTLRIHLDPAASENGALCVLPGSHRSGKAMEQPTSPRLVTSNAGDVFAMRPLLTHCSGSSAAAFCTSSSPPAANCRMDFAGIPFGRCLRDAEDRS